MSNATRAQIKSQVEQIQVGKVERVCDVEVYRTLGHGRILWIVDPHGPDREECRTAECVVAALNEVST